MDSKKALKQLKALSKSNPMRLAAEDWKAPWQTLISTIMSARTRDEVTIPVAEKLFQRYSSLEKLSNAKVKDIEKIIRPINFYRNKSKNLLNCAKMLVNDYKGKVPSTIDELIKLPGVGRKTANVFLVEHDGHGIAVDTHVFYISRYLGWSKNHNPHKVEADLKSLFTKQHWNKVNATLVRFGKTHTSRKQKDKLLDEIKRIN